MRRCWIRSACSLICVHALSIAALPGGMVFASALVTTEVDWRGGCRRPSSLGMCVCMCACPQYRRPPRRAGFRQGSGAHRSELEGRMPQTAVRAVFGRAPCWWSPSREQARFQRLQPKGCWPMEGSPTASPRRHHWACACVHACPQYRRPPRRAGFRQRSGGEDAAVQASRHREQSPMTLAARSTTASPRRHHWACAWKCTCVQACEGRSDQRTCVVLNMSTSSCRSRTCDVSTPILWSASVRCVSDMVSGLAAMACTILEFCCRLQTKEITRECFERFGLVSR